ncbi:MAG: SRPBCC domain-containing protein [Candidatus Eremiobacteraeota bacterium]|nr:SRPBCC domain-containing protein [Candidatus Eremiobacteraeota bacterium]
MDLLRSSPRTTGDLCSRFPVTRTAVMKHLSVLEEARLISVRRKGRERWNYINATPLRSIYERWLTPYRQLWATSLSRLAAVVEGESVSSQIKTPALSHDEIVQTVDLSVPAERAFEALTRNIGKWWSHVTFKPEGVPDLRLEPTAGGKFVETQGDKQRLYAVVTRIEPPRLLYLEGNMGMGGCIFGTITFELADTTNGCRLALEHKVMGVYDADVIAMYRGGWASLLEQGLKPFVEDGVEAWGATA